MEDIPACLAAAPEEALALTGRGFVAVLVDPSGTSVEALRPDVVVDAVLAKRNLGTHLTDASCVVGVGPGFLPGRDCHAAVETQRGHDLGRVLWDRAPASNTGVPGEIGGYTVERLLRAPADGVFLPAARIGDLVEARAAGWIRGRNSYARPDLRCPAGTSARWHSRPHRNEGGRYRSALPPGTLFFRLRQGKSSGRPAYWRPF